MTHEEQLNGVQSRKGLIDTAKDVVCGAFGWFCGDKGRTPPTPPGPAKNPLASFTSPDEAGAVKEFSKFDLSLIKPGELPFVPGWPEKPSTVHEPQAEHAAQEPEEEGGGFFNVDPARKESAGVGGMPGFQRVKGVAVKGKVAKTNAPIELAPGIKLEDLLSQNLNERKNASTSQRYSGRPEELYKAALKAKYGDKKAQEFVRNYYKNLDKGVSFSGQDGRRAVELGKILSEDGEIEKGRKNWASLNRSEKTAVFVRVSKRFGEVFGIADPAPVFIEDGAENEMFARSHKTGGYYDGRKIVLNEKYMDDFDEGVASVVHEQTHHYQKELVRRYYAGEIKPGDESFTQAQYFESNNDWYIPNDGLLAYFEYRAQPIEAQAMEVGDIAAGTSRLGIWMDGAWDEAKEKLGG